MGYLQFVLLPRFHKRNGRFNLPENVYWLEAVEDTIVDVFGIHVSWNGLDLLWRATAQKLQLLLSTHARITTYSLFRSRTKHAVTPLRSRGLCSFGQVILWLVYHRSVGKRVLVDALEAAVSQSARMHTVKAENIDCRFAILSRFRLIIATPFEISNRRLALRRPLFV